MMSQKYPWVRQVFSMMTRPSFSRTMAGMTLMHSGQTDAVFRGSPRGAWNSFITRAGIYSSCSVLWRIGPNRHTHSFLHNPSVVRDATQRPRRDDGSHGLSRYKRRIYVPERVGFIPDGPMPAGQLSDHVTC